MKNLPYENLPYAFKIHNSLPQGFFLKALLSSFVKMGYITVGNFR